MRKPDQKPARLLDGSVAKPAVSKDALVELLLESVQYSLDAQPRSLTGLNPRGLPITTRYAVVMPA